MNPESCSDNEKEQNDNRRMLVQNFNDRINHLAGLILTIDGFIVAIFIGILVGLFAIKDLIGVIILVFCGIFSLIGWRYWANSIDKQIVEFYGLFLQCENKLKVEYNFSLLKRLFTLYEKETKNKVEPEIKNKPELQIELILGLDKNQFPDRGHRRNDKIAYFAIVFFIGILIYRFIRINQITFDIMTIVSGFVLIFIFITSVIYGIFEWD